jgi:NAD(P)-dependent dehydrogenase (short-subunit alcohol dehydrogenase family)
MSDRILAVIGGTSGIGLKAARLAGSRGDNVIITGRESGRVTDALADVASVERFVTAVSLTVYCGWEIT